MASPLRRFAVGFVALALGAWTACVGDNPAPASGGAATGDRLGPCFADGKCKEGLVCRDGEICLTPDEPKPNIDGGAPDSASPSDAAGDARSNAQACTPYMPPVQSGVIAGAYCPPQTCTTQNDVCCLVNQTLSCGAQGSAACPQVAPFWTCETQTQCGNLRCCLRSNAPTAGTSGTTTCEARSSGGRTTCEVPNDCTATGGRETCNTNTDCPHQNCRAEEVETALGFSIVIKVCAD